MSDTFVGGGDTVGTSAASRAEHEAPEPSVAVFERRAVEGE
jgi:hypothetical protein